jgi:adenylate cyclase
MFTDIVGYTALTQSNEAQAMEVLERHNRLLRPFFPRFHGREVKTIGDSFLVEFESALDALNCASEIQSYLHDYNVSSKEEWKIKLRIGIHLGDVIHRGGDVLGDAVNIASRIEPIAGPEGICVSQQVYDQVQNKFDLPLLSLGEKTLKNVSRLVQVYSVQMPWEQTATPEAAIYPTNRIAILPFASFSPDPNDAYFADGVTDEIISAVAGISGLSVISRTSVVGYKGTTKKVEEIGRELKVGSILEGTFKKAGNRMRVTTQLIDVANDRHLWAQNYDRNLDDVFEVQSDVAKQVAEALRVRILTPEKERIERKPTDSTTAYTLYLKGRQLWNKREIDDVKEALACFERAVKEDPAFALGYVGQADCYLVAELIPGIEGVNKAKSIVAKSLELDPDLAEAHTTNGLVLTSEYDLRHAEEEFKRAIELKPSYATAHQWYQLNVLIPELRWDEALEHIAKAVELDPLSPIMHVNLGLYYRYRREYGKQIEPLKRALELGANYVHGNLAVAYGMMKMFEEMRREAETHIRYMEARYPRMRTHMEAHIAYFKDDKEALRRLLPELESHLQESGSDPCEVADFHFHIGEIDKGFEWLEQSYTRREGSLLDIQVDWDLDGVRTDPRYLDLLRKLGLN